jgi:protein TonB
MILAMIILTNKRIQAQNNNVDSNTVKKSSFTCYMIVEEIPSYPGGDEARIKFIQDNLQYPIVAKQNNIQGTVYVKFMVEANGTISDINILKGIGGGCDEEALRVVKIMPKWLPGSQNGKPTKIYFNMPIIFKLDKNIENEEKNIKQNK